MIKDIAIGAKCAVVGTVVGERDNWVIVEMQSGHGMTAIYTSVENIAYVGPAALAVGDTVLSKDGCKGVIRYINDDWCLVVTHGRLPSIRYLCDLQRVPS